MSLTTRQPTPDRVPRTRESPPALAGPRAPPASSLRQPVRCTGRGLVGLAGFAGHSPDVVDTSDASEHPEAVEPSTAVLWPEAVESFSACAMPDATEPSVAVASPLTVWPPAEPADSANTANTDTTKADALRLLFVLIALPFPGTPNANGFLLFQLTNVNRVVWRQATLLVMLAGALSGSR